MHRGDLQFIVNHFATKDVAERSESAKGGSRDHLDAITGTEQENGLWNDRDGHRFRASASDLERFVYCPRSWMLNKVGVRAQGKNVEKGVEQHNVIDENFREVVKHRKRALQTTLIWSWWALIVVALLIDAMLIRFADRIVDPSSFAVMLVSLSVAWLVIGVFLVILPWRNKLEIEGSGTENPAKDPIWDLITPAFDPVIQPEEFRGGWWKVGSVEVTIFLAAASLSVHGMALIWAQDRAYLAFILVLLAMVWNGMTSFRLNRMISATEQAKVASDDLNLDASDEVAYSDGVKMAGLFHDSDTGLRGRPDQVLRVDGRYVPVEQKTGKVPSFPHKSHRLQLLAYLQLIDVVSDESPKHGLLRYGPHDAHLVPWDETTKIELIEHLGALHTAMGTGTANRNHEQIGKCRSCSRRQGCDQRLDRQ